MLIEGTLNFLNLIVDESDPTERTLDNDNDDIIDNNDPEASGIEVLLRQNQLHMI